MSDPNIAVYLDPSLGRTDVPAAVANASDLSAAGWTPTGLSARTATTLTDDGSNGEHCVAQTVAGVNLKHATTVSFTIPAGSTRYIAVSFDNAAAQAVIDTQAPASIAFQTGWNATATLVGGVFTGIRTTVTNGALKLYAANGAAWANTSYAGASNIAGAFTSVTVTQPNASALADQTGNGRNILQATAANRTAVVDASGKPWTSGRARIYTDGVNDYSQGAFSLGAPTTVTALWCGKWADVFSTPSSAFDAKTGGGMFFYRSAAGTLRYFAGGSGRIVSGLDDVNTHTWMVVFNSSATSYLYCDGVLKDSGAIGVLTADGLTVGASGVPNQYGSIYTDEGPHLILRAGDVGLAQRWYAHCKARGFL